MSQAKLVKQVVATTPNETGEFFKVTSALADAQVNLKGICAWGQGIEAHFALLTDNNAKAIAALSAKGIKANEEEAVAVILEDKIGAAGTIAKKIKEANINLEYVYGTTCGCKDTSALLVLVSKENAKIISSLK
jgi:hypothetical protein